VLNAEHKYDEALAAMRAGADAEDKTEKSPVTPGPLAPARELLGDMLMARGDAAAALAAYEATLAKEPHRFNATAGAALAADKLGDKAKATAYYEKLVALAAGSDSERPALTRAKQYLVKN
jgi:tetratricopeptide (TPR) repeat protein